MSKFNLIALYVLVVMFISFCLGFFTGIAGLVLGIDSTTLWIASVVVSGIIINIPQVKAGIWTIVYMIVKGE